MSALQTLRRSPEDIRTIRQTFSLELRPVGIKQTSEIRTFVLIDKRRFVYSPSAGRPELLEGTNECSAVSKGRQNSIEVTAISKLFVQHLIGHEQSYVRRRRNAFFQRCLQDLLRQR